MRILCGSLTRNNKVHLFFWTKVYELSWFFHSNNGSAANKRNYVESKKKCICAEVDCMELITSLVAQMKMPRYIFLPDDRKITLKNVDNTSWLVWSE